MKNSVNKGFFTYFLIFLVIVVAIVLTVGAIMLLSPEVKILGYQYIDSKTTMKITSYNGTDYINNLGANLEFVDDEGTAQEKIETGAEFINFDSLSKLIIKTNHMNVDIIYGEEDKIDIVRSVTGFTKVGTVEKLVATKHYKGSTFTITALDTNPGLTLTNNSKIRVHLKSREVNLSVEVSSLSANFSIATSAFNSTTQTDLSLKDVVYETETGNLNLSKTATITNKIVVNSTEKTKVLIDKNQVLNYDFALNLKEGNITVKNITAPSATIGGELVVFTGKNLLLNTGLTLKLKNGDITLEKVQGFVIDENEIAENLGIKIKEVTGEFTISKNEADLKKANKAKIELESVEGLVTIRTSSGNVRINKALRDVDIETVSGLIYVQNKNQNAKFNLKTETGDIFVNVEFVKGVDNQVYSEKGKVVLNYLNSLSNFEINISTKNKKSITFQPANTTYESQTVVGYPTPLDQEPSTSYTKKINIYAGGKVVISAVSKLVAFK